MVCQECGGLRHVPDPEQPGRWRDCECLKRERHLAQLKRTGIDREFYTLSPNSLPATAWAASLRRALADLTLSVKEGKSPSAIAFSGKSERNRAFACALVVRTFLKYGQTARLLPVSRLLGVVLGQDAEYTSVNELLQDDCLGLELGYEFAPTKAAMAVMLVLRDRRARGRYTFFSTTESQEGVKRMYGEELHRFLTDRERCVWLQVGAEK